MKMKQTTHTALSVAKRIAMAMLLIVLCGRVGCQETDIAAPADDFVIASLVVADPGGALYARFGHVSMHLQCPEHNLDYIFSYESEDVRHKVPAFLAGKLKMGLFAIPTEEYLDFYRREGRGVREYRLNLPIRVKQELWRVHDNHLLKDNNLPFDYLNYGCVHRALLMLKEALDTIPIDYGPWPERLEHLNRRELTALQLGNDSPWTRAFLCLIANGSINADCSIEDKIIMPADLLEVLQRASVQGQPLLDSEPHQLLAGTPVAEKYLLSPLAVSLILLLLMVLCLLLRKPWMDYILLVLQTLLGIVTVYLVCFSTLCCTEWSWLIVPFNPLPLLAWRWRRHWALPYAAVLALWIVFILLWPHSLTDWPYIILTTALILSYVNIFVSDKTHKK